MDGWNTTFLLGFGLFSGALAVSFREGTIPSDFLSPTRDPVSSSDLLPVEISLTAVGCIQPNVGWKTILANQVDIPSSKLTCLAGKSPFSIGNTYSIRVQCPSSYVSLPERIRKSYGKKGGY